jgi:formylglycine-generating enzyme required for sulfatase activity
MSDVCSLNAGLGSLGLCDLIGNVSELTADPWHSSLQGAPTDGSAWCSGASCEAEGLKVVKGGSHATRGSPFDPPFSLHSRFDLSSSNASESVGFRLVRSLVDLP